MANLLKSVKLLSVILIVLKKSFFFDQKNTNETFYCISNSYSQL